MDVSGRVISPCSYGYYGGSSNTGPPLDRQRRVNAVRKQQPLQACKPIKWFHQGIVFQPEIPLVPWDISMLYTIRNPHFITVAAGAVTDPPCGNDRPAHPCRSLQQIYQAVLSVREMVTSPCSGSRMVMKEQSESNWRYG